MRLPLEAAIFDLDGVLIDSEPLHQRALCSVLAAGGHHLADEEYAGLVGVSQDRTWAWLASRFGLRGDLSCYAAAYKDAVLHLMQGSLDPERGALDLIDALRRDGWKLALASSSPSAWVAASLAGLGLDRTFQVVVTGDQVSHGKPDPEIFLAAAARLAVPPHRTLVIEDSGPGVEAGLRAGMRVVAVRTRYNLGKRLPAHLVVSSLGELVSPEARARLVGEVLEPPLP